MSNFLPSEYITTCILLCPHNWKSIKSLLPLDLENMFKCQTKCHKNIIQHTLLCKYFCKLLSKWLCKSIPSNILPALLCDTENEIKCQNIPTYFRALNMLKLMLKSKRTRGISFWTHLAQSSDYSSKAVPLQEQFKLLMQTTKVKAFRPLGHFGYTESILSKSFATKTHYHKYTLNTCYGQKIYSIWP